MSNIVTALALLGSKSGLQLNRLYEEDSNGVVKAQTRYTKEAAKEAAAEFMKSGTKVEPETFTIASVTITYVGEVSRESLLKTKPVAVAEKPELPDLADTQG